MRSLVLYPVAFGFGVGFIAAGIVLPLIAKVTEKVVDGIAEKLRRAAS